jgi:hypothetical protein
VEPETEPGPGEPTILRGPGPLLGDADASIEGRDITVGGAPPDNFLWRDDTNTRG